MLNVDESNERKKMFTISIYLSKNGFAEKKISQQTSIYL